MPELTPRQREQISALKRLPDDQIDTTDAPEVLNWSNVTRGAFYRPGEKHVGRAAGAVTDTSEKGLERLICEALTGAPCDTPPDGALEERPAAYGFGWVCGDPHDYEREYCVDLAKLAAFLEATQPVVAESLDLRKESPTRRKFLARLQSEVSKRGTIDVLRKGVKHGPYQIELMYGTPSPGNQNAEALYRQNRFSVTRQLRYSNDNPQLALDVCLFVNGLPVATFELKNSLTKQTVEDAVEQYKRDRNPRERLFELGRCLAHFAVDDQEVKFCTHLTGKSSWFLPFNKGGTDGGAGNPPNPNGLRTDYLWKQVLTRDGLTDIIENYAQILESKDEKTGRRKREQIWPRYHQLDVVRELLADASERGAGPRYLIQHSAGSGKSNSIAWLAYQLIGLKHDDKTIFDSVIVITDRRVLDRQIRDTIKQFAQVGSTVGHAETSAHLRTLLQAGKRIVITTVQKFPFIVDAIGSEHQGRTFALIIDEAHSSQGGKTSAAVGRVLGEVDAEEEETTEDKINQIMESRKLLTNASYFAFTATPKNKTLEIFGALVPEGGKTRHVPFHSYTMKQAIQEGFILDVLAHYTTANSYYRLVKTVEGDPEFDTNRASKKLRRYVEEHDHAIRLKAEMMVDNFNEQAAGQRKIGGLARAMVVTGSVNRAITYFYAIRDYLTEWKIPYRAIVAFSGEHEYEGTKVTEASLNGFPSNLIEEKIQEEPYRFLVCADKFQTGYDEPLLHTMYVDKVLSGVKAVQTLSRLNRAHPKKHDTFVLDFANDADTIQNAFADYYRTTILSEETDPNRLHDLKATLDGYQVYSPAQVDKLVELYLGGADRDKLDPILDACVAVYREQLDEDGQVDFKGKAKAFLRSYDFLGAILPYAYAEWEKLSIFLTFLVPKLPAPIEDDFSKGILETIDMDSYRVEKQAVQAIQLADEDAEIPPIDTGGGGQKAEPEMDRLSNILKDFNNRFGNIEWKDQDKIGKVIIEELPAKVAEDQAYKNAMANSDKQNARIEHDKALERAMNELLYDHTELFKQFSDNESFRRWVTEMSFAMTYIGAALRGQPPAGSPSA